jgi:tetraacyldisaccharide 4'-kinase
MSASCSWLVRTSRALELINATARLPYRLGFRRPRRVPATVISVGNIALGGTGKTPLVISLTEALLGTGARPAVLTRGYRRSGREPILFSNGDGVPWQRVGDEPAMLARALPGVPVMVDEDRVAGATRAIHQADATHLVLDDGFQHWRLARDLDIVVVDGRDPLCHRRPRREHPRTLSRADVVVIVFTDATDASAAESEVRAVAPHARRLTARVRPQWLHRSGAREPAGALTGRRVLAAAGIAEPKRFFDLLRCLGAEVVGAVRRPDHYAWHPEEIEALLHAAAARTAQLVMTAKDVVKLPPALTATVAWLEIRLEPESGSFLDLLTVQDSPLSAGGQERRRGTTDWPQ